MMNLSLGYIDQCVIDLSDRDVILVSVETMGMYYVTGKVAITWVQVLEEFLEKKLDKQCWTKQ